MQNDRLFAQTIRHVCRRRQTASTISAEETPTQSQSPQQQKHMINSMNNYNVLGCACACAPSLLYLISLMNPKSSTNWLLIEIEAMAITNPKMFRNFLRLILSHGCMSLSLLLSKRVHFHWYGWLCWVCCWCRCCCKCQLPATQMIARERKRNWANEWNT